MIFKKRLDFTSSLRIIPLPKTWSPVPTLSSPNTETDFQNSPWFGPECPTTSWSLLFSIAPSNVDGGFSFVPFVNCAILGKSLWIPSSVSQSPNPYSEGAGLCKDPNSPLHLYKFAKHFISLDPPHSPMKWRRPRLSHFLDKDTSWGALPPSSVLTLQARKC